MINIIRSSFIVFIVLFYSMANAAQVSQQQIEQFKNLPKAQQEALAKSMGVDLNALTAQIKSDVDNDNNANVSASGKKPFQQAYQNTQEEDEDDDKTEDLLAADAKIFKPLAVFGLDVFSNNNISDNAFSPIMDIAIPEHYILGTGDQISLQIFGKENSEHTLTITREGTVVVPNVGQINVAGLTFTDMKQLLAERVKQRIIGVNAVVSLAQLRSMRIFVLGEAHNPGPYTLSSLSSVTHAIFAAGGISDIGSLRNIMVKRSGKVVKHVDLYDLLIDGDSSSDIILQSGDVVFIPPKGNSVSIAGEVRRPAIYELTHSDNYDSVLKMAGGMLPSAYPKATVVERYNKQNLRTIINVDLTKTAAKKQKVNNGDYIRILKTSSAVEQAVTVIGAVTRPGKYQWREGLTIADVIPSVDSHVLPYADLDYGIIVREKNSARHIEVLQFSLAKIVADNTTTDNLPLQAKDKILIFSNVLKHIDENSTLDEMAYTQKQLLAKERETAKLLFQEESFWQEYGGDASQSQMQENEEEESKKIINQSLVQLVDEDEEVDIKDMSLFSRQRLLVSVIKQLRKQGSSGQPIQLVEIDGEVKFPGIYPLAVNGRVKDLIIAAGGVNESAYLNRADITRNTVESEQAKKISLQVNIQEALQEITSANITMHSKDRLHIHKIPAWSENHVIELKGEFVFPGKYTISRGETLSEVIEKAGGFTEYAHIEGSVFSRLKLKELEQKNLHKLASDLNIELAAKSLTDKGVSVPYGDAQKMLNDIASVEPIGRLVIDLPKVIAKQATDVLLERGDVLYVPAKKNSVNVIGQVQVASSHVYDVTMSAQDYISQSGGTKKRADKSRIYVISANGRIQLLTGDNWFSANQQKLKVGDTIVVPLDTEYKNNLELWSTVTQIIYNTAVAFSAIKGI